MENNNLFDKYRLVYRKLRSIFDQIYEEYNISEKVNPIEHIKYRIKKPNSIKQKLIKLGEDSVNEENMDNLLFDVVGVRIVCSFLSDLEILKNVVKKLDENNILEIIEEKDYVTHPKKESGYSSYHMRIRVPVNYNNEIKYVNAEIQIRTIAMDMSASLEHKSCYKKQGYSDNLKRMAREATEFCNSIDKDLDMVVKSIDVDQNDSLQLSYPFMNGKEFNLFKLKYNSALNFVRGKFIDLYSFYDRNEEINPIEHMKSRIKSDSSVLRKLIRKDKGISVDSIEKYVNDFAGVRIVCSFLSDLEDLKEFIRNDNDFQILEEKDYVTYPKKSGYRGYHFLVGVPVYTLNGIEYVKVEIELRTIAMEMWASLEEKIGYHKNPEEKIVEELQRISSVTSVLDNQFDIIYTESKRQQLQDVNVKKRVRMIESK